VAALSSRLPLLLALVARPGCGSQRWPSCVQPAICPMQKRVLLVLPPARRAASGNMCLD
jgi:hypothetical protein